MVKYTLHSLTREILGTADSLDKARAKAIEIIRERNPTGIGRFTQVDIWTASYCVGSVVMGKSKVTKQTPYYPIGQRFISFSWSPNYNDDVDYDLYMNGTIAYRMETESEGSTRFVYKGKKRSQQAWNNIFKKTHFKV